MTVQDDLMRHFLLGDESSVYHVQTSSFILFALFSITLLPSGNPKTTRPLLNFSLALFLLNISRLIE